MNRPIVGTWDALEEAVDALEKGGLVFVLTVGMDGNRWARTRTNACDRTALEWLEEQHESGIDELRDRYQS